MNTQEIENYISFVKSNNICRENEELFRCPFTGNIAKKFSSVLHNWWPKDSNADQLKKLYIAQIGLNDKQQNVYMEYVTVNFIKKILPLIL